MVGTILVQFPGAYYEGGALEISAGILKKKLVLEGHKTPPEYSYGYMRSIFNWQLPDPTKLRVAAFFCDIDHEVLEVDEGIRLTAAFILRIKDKQVPELPSANLNSMVLPKRLSSSEQETALAAKFVEFCNDESFLPEKENTPIFLAFPCFHLYTNEQVFPSYIDSAENPLTEAQVAKLKGKDSILGKAVLSASEKTGGCVEIYLQPMVDHEFASECGGPYLTSQFPDCCISERMDDDAIDKEFDPIGNFDEEFQPIWVIDQKLGHEPDSIGETCYSPDGYYGNEASQLEFYVKSLLRVEFAPYTERKKMIEENKENCVPGSKRKINISATSKPKKLIIRKPDRYDPTRYIISRGCSP